MDLLILILLIAFGLLLIAAEVYLIPGLNVVGVAGLLSIAIGVGYAYYTFGTLGGTLALFSAVGSIGMLFTLMWRSGAWNRFVLATHLGRDPLREAEEQDNRARYLGQQGVALSPLRPTGVIDVAGERLEVQTEGAFIAAGSRVRIVAMDRRRYFVRLADELLPEAKA